MIELATELESLGWRCRLASDEEICPGIREVGGGLRRAVTFSRALAAFLVSHAKDFDVADYDHLYLPEERDRFPRSTLFVARCALLLHHMDRIRFPRIGGLRSRVGSIVKGPYRQLNEKFYTWQATRTLREADLINVSNDRDLDELSLRGLDPNKIAVLPLGITEQRLEEFGTSPRVAPADPRIAFVGTFDARKGAGDLSKILGLVTVEVPNCKLRILGARNTTERRIRSEFPSRLQSSLEIQPNFDPDELPELLRGCSLGIFPSYVEGFGFSVVEMLAASLPVLAYDVPGPSAIVAPEHLVPRGDTAKMAARAVALLRDPDQLTAARMRARKRAHDLSWVSAAKMTSTIYAERVARLRNAFT